MNKQNLRGILNSENFSTKVSDECFKLLYFINTTPPHPIQNPYLPYPHFTKTQGFNQICKIHLTLREFMLYDLTLLHSKRVKRMYLHVV